jgi:hypothetical protein
METITGYLVADHERLGRELAASIAGVELDLAAYDRFRRGLLRHIGIEEKVLFLEAKRRRGSPLPDAHRLRIEHASLTSLLVPTPDRALVDEIRGLIAVHDAREEGDDGVYAQCERLFGDDSAALAEKAREFAEIRAMPHYDGPGVVRTAAAALASAERIRPPS